MNRKNARNLRGSSTVPPCRVPGFDLNGLPHEIQARRPGTSLGRTLGLMSQFHSIVVPLDGSQLAEHALTRALGIARRTGATVRLVHAFSPLDAVRDTWEYHVPGLYRQLLEQKHAYLADVVRRISDTNLAPVPIVSVVVENSLPADGVCSAASGADLVVMASRKRGPMGRFLHGSVMDTLMGNLQCPRLFVRGYDSPVDLTGDPLVRRTLIPLDGSVPHERILGPATALSRFAGADMTLMNVQRADAAYTGFHYCTPGGYLISVGKAIAGHVERVQACVVETERRVAKAILSFSDEIEADLIALTTRGRGAMSRLLRESVAYTVARTAKVPVLVLQPYQATTAIQAPAAFD